MSELNVKQEKFVAAVSKGVGNQQAAIIAGYSVRSAAALATRLLKNVKIAEALKERQEYYRSISNVEASEVIGAQKEIAFAAIEEALDDNGYLDFKKAKANGSAKLIKKLSRQHTKYGETVSVEFYSRSDALNQLADILGIKQQAKANEADIQSIADQVLNDLIDNGWQQDDARVFVDQKYPTVSSAVN